jgi:hypothetical protein
VLRYFENIAFLMGTFSVLVLFWCAVLTEMVQVHNLLGAFRSTLSSIPNLKVKAISESSFTTKFHYVNGRLNDIIIDASTLLIIRFICDRSLIVIHV